MTAAFLISNAILGAAVLAFCVLIVRTILRRSPASIRHLALAAGFAATLALPFGALLLQSAPSVLRVRSMVVLFVTPDDAGPLKAHSLAGIRFPLKRSQLLSGRPEPRCCCFDCWPDFCIEADRIDQRTTQRR